MRLKTLAPLLVLLAGCQKSDDLLIGGVRLAAEAATVQREPGSGTPVELLVVNDRSFPVYLPACDGRPRVEMERRRGSGWENAGAGICTAEKLMVPVALEAGAQLRVAAGVSGTGTFRAALRVSIRADGADSRRLASNEFTVR